jgi:hypothetical protein
MALIVNGMVRVTGGHPCSRVLQGEEHADDANIPKPLRPKDLAVHERPVRLGRVSAFGTRHPDHGTLDRVQVVARHAHRGGERGPKAAKPMMLPAGSRRRSRRPALNH